MAYSDNFPATRPVFMADFANGGKIDPRATFSRASTANVFDGAKHLSSENLLTHSNDISGAYGKNGLTETGGQTAPDGGTDAYKLTEDSATGFHRIYYASSVLSSGSLTVSCYVKYIGRQWVYIRLRDSGAAYRHVWFDVQNGTKGTEETNMTGTISASGGGYYKLTATVSSVHATSADVRIGGANADGNTQYAGSGSDAFSVWGIQASTTGETVLNETSGQIHREYAPSLVSKANNAARFETATDGQSGAKGILIEGQSTNAVGYSDSLASWNQSRLTATNASAVGPTGSLNAALLTPSTDAGFEHIIYATSVTTSVTGTVTLSGYFKAAGYDYVTLGIGNTATGNFSHALFNLSTGAYVTNNSGGSNSYVSSSTESVGNGWWRLVATFSTSRSNEQFVIGPASTSSPTYDSNWGTPTYTGDGYSSVLATGIQAEVGKSFASSLITSNSGSETTRASDSLSVATADIGYTGGPVSGIVDAVNIGAANYPTFATISDSTGNQRVMVQGNSSNVDTYVLADGTQVANPSSALNTAASKVGFRSDTNNFATVVNGGTVATDTSGPIPASASTLHIGQNHNSQYQVNGNIKRIAIYNEALSNTNLQALTS